MSDTSEKSKIDADLKPLIDGPGVYLILNKENGKFYIGSSATASARVRVHLKGSGSVVVGHALKKHGEESFCAFLLESCPREDLPSREGFWIQKLKPNYNLTTLTDTGGRINHPASIAKTQAARAGYRHSPETRRKIGEANKGRLRTPEQQARMSKALKESPRVQAHVAKLIEQNAKRIKTPEEKARWAAKVRGRKWTPEQKAAASLRHAGKKMSEEARSKMRLAKLGVKQSPEHIANRAHKMKGNKNGLGVKKKSETIEKFRKSMIESWARRKQIDPSCGKVSDETRKKISEAAAKKRASRQAKEGPCQCPPTAI